MDERTLTVFLQVHQGTGFCLHCIAKMVTAVMGPSATAKAVRRAAGVIRRRGDCANCGRRGLVFCARPPLPLARPAGEAYR